MQKKQYLSSVVTDAGRHPFATYQRNWDKDSQRSQTSWRSQFVFEFRIVSELRSMRDDRDHAVETFAAMRVFTDKCQDLQWVDVTSETSGVAERAGRRVQERTANGHPNDGGTVRWNVTDSFGTTRPHSHRQEGIQEHIGCWTFDPFGSNISQKPISSNAESNLHQLVWKVLNEMFISFVFRSEGGTDLLIADCEGPVKLSASEIYLKRIKHLEVAQRKLSLPCARRTFNWSKMKKKKSTPPSWKSKRERRLEHEW